MSEWNPPEHRVVEIPRGPSTIKGSSRSYLNRGILMCEGIMKANKRSWKPMGHLKDNNGTYAYSANADSPDLPSFKLLLIARKYIMGNTVGAGEDIIARCIDEKRHLLIFIFQANKIYRFDPEECRLKGKVSTRGFRTFYDFQISLGINLVKYMMNLHKIPEISGLQKYL